MPLNTIPHYGITNRVQLTTPRPYVNGFLNSCFIECKMRLSKNAAGARHLKRGRNTDAGDHSQPTPTQGQRTNNVEAREFEIPKYFEKIQW